MLNNWCKKTWLYVLYASGVIMLLFYIFNLYYHWNEDAYIVGLFPIILPFHVFEEWQFPGGFHYHYNVVMGSKYPNRYPMSRLTDMLTNSIAQVIFIIITFTGVNSSIYFALLCFSIIEVVAHTFFGVRMYKLFKEKGKRTIYAPGSVTAYCGFGVVAIMLIMKLGEINIIGNEVIVGIVYLLLFLVVVILLPEGLLKKEDNEYAYSSAGYYEKYL